MESPALKCYICLDEINNKPIRVKCEHVVCSDCIAIWLITNECIICSEKLKKRLKKLKDSLPILCSKNKTDCALERIHFYGPQFLFGIISLVLLVSFQLIKQFLKK